MGWQGHFVSRCPSHVGIEPGRELALAAQQLQGLPEHVLARLVRQRVVVDGGAPDVMEVGVAGGGQEGAEKQRSPPQDHEALQQKNRM